MTLEFEVDDTEVSSPEEFAEFLYIMADIMKSKKVHVIILPALLSQAADMITSLSTLTNAAKVIQSPQMQMKE